MLDRTPPTADGELARYAENLVKPLDDAVPESVALEVRKILTFLLPLGQASVSDVTEALHKSRRTLQRQLQAEGLDYLRDGIKKTPLGAVNLFGKLLTLAI